MCERVTPAFQHVIPAKAGIAPATVRGTRRGRSALSRGRQAAVLIIGLLAPSVVFAAPTADQILELADAPKRAFPEVVIHARVTVEENGTSQIPAEFDLYKKGEDRAIVVFTAGKQKGRKILTVGDRFWILVPGASHAIPVTPNQRLIGGAALGDVARLRFSKEFDATLEPGPETVSGESCDVLDLKAKSSGSPYGSGKLWVDRAKHLPRKAVLNLVSGKPSKEIDFERYGVVNGKTVLESMAIRDRLAATGSITRLEYSGYKILKIDDSFFTPEGALKF